MSINSLRPPGIEEISRAVEAARSKRMQVVLRWSDWSRRKQWELYVSRRRVLFIGPAPVVSVTELEVNREPTDGQEKLYITRLKHKPYGLALMESGARGVQFVSRWYRAKEEVISKLSQHFGLEIVSPWE